MVHGVQMRGLVMKSAGSSGVSVSDLPVPLPRSDQVLIKIRRTAICGTDLKIVFGGYPWRVDPEFPLIVGHEAVGEIVELGSDVPRGRLHIGETVVPLALQPCGACVMCLSDQSVSCVEPRHLGINIPGTFAEYVAVKHDCCISVDEGISDNCAAYLEPMAIIARTLEAISLDGVKRIGVIGPGPIGLLHVLALRAISDAEISVFGTERDGLRLSLARKLGADDAIALSDVDGINRSWKVSDIGFDLVIEAALLGEAVNGAFRLAKPGGTVVLKGIASDTTVDPLLIVRRQLHVIGQAGAEARHYSAAIRLINERGIRPSRIVTDYFSIDQGREAFQAMYDHKRIVAFDMSHEVSE